MSDTKIETLAKVAGVSAEKFVQARKSLLVAGGPPAMCCLLRRLQEGKMNLDDIIKFAKEMDEGIYQLAMEAELNLKDAVVFASVLRDVGTPAEWLQIHEWKIPSMDEVSSQKDGQCWGFCPFCGSLIMDAYFCGAEESSAGPSKVFRATCSRCNKQMALQSWEAVPEEPAKKLEAQQTLLGEEVMVQ